VVDTHQTVELKGVKFKAYTAGHVLGACMYMIEIGGVNVLYTGDYSTEEDRHLMGAEVTPNEHGTRGCHASSSPSLRRQSPPLLSPPP
jgi:Cft2 family RNA processing exonuclease